MLALPFSAVGKEKAQPAQDYQTGATACRHPYRQGKQKGNLRVFRFPKLLQKLRFPLPLQLARPMTKRSWREDVKIRRPEANPPKPHRASSSEKVSTHAGDLFSQVPRLYPANLKAYCAPEMSDVLALTWIRERNTVIINKNMSARFVAYCFYTSFPND